MIKIPFVFYFKQAEKIDYEALGIVPPVEDEDSGEREIHDVWIKAELIEYIEPNIEDGGSFVRFSGVSWQCTLEPNDIAEKVIEALRKK